MLQISDLTDPGAVLNCGAAERLDGTVGGLTGDAEQALAARPTEPINGPAEIPDYNEKLRAHEALIA